jgi:hypothetical protein
MDNTDDDATATAVDKKKNNIRGNYNTVTMSCVLPSVWGLVFGVWGLGLAQATRHAEELR